MRYRAADRISSLVVRRGSSDTSVVGQIFVDRAFDLSGFKRFEEICAFAKATEVATGKRPLIVDGGANIGLTSIYFNAGFPTAEIVAVEPEPNNFALLVRNAANERVMAIPCALASEPGQTTVFDAGAGDWGFRTGAASDAASATVVDCITMNEILAAHAAECFPFIIKIDIEGAEEDLFSKGLSWIEKTPVLIVELHDWMLPRGGTAKTFLKAVADLDRDFIIMGENIVSIANDLGATVAAAVTTAASDDMGVYRSYLELAKASTKQALTRSLETFDGRVEILRYEVGELADEKKALEARAVALEGQNRDLRDQIADLKQQSDHLRAKYDRTLGRRLSRAWKSLKGGSSVGGA